jgi:DNA-directed RNA polymerase specialized sigma24 family protein
LNKSGPASGCSACRNQSRQTALVLQHHFALSHTEIAETLGIPVGTVKSRLRYATAAMRAPLDADDRLDLALAEGRSA